MTPVITELRHFHLDHPSPEVSQQHGCIRTGQNAAQINYNKSVKRSLLIHFVTPKPPVIYLSKPNSCCHFFAILRISFETAIRRLLTKASWFFSMSVSLYR